MTWLRSIRFRIIAAVVVAIAAMLGAMGFLQVQYSAVSARQALITEGYLPIAQRVDALSLYQERVDNDIERLLRGDRRPGTGSASSTVIFSERLRINIEEARIRARTTQKITNDPREQAVLHTVLAQLQRVEELFAQYEEQSSALVAQLESQPIPPTVPAAPEPTDLEVTTDRLDPQILQNTAARLGDEVDKLSRQVQGRISGLAQETEAQRVRANAVAALLARDMLIGAHPVTLAKDVPRHLVLVTVAVWLAIPAAAGFVGHILFRSDSR